MCRNLWALLVWFVNRHCCRQYAPIPQYHRLCRCSSFWQWGHDYSWRSSHQGLGGKLNEIWSYWSKRHEFFLCYFSREIAITSAQRSSICHCDPDGRMGGRIEENDNELPKWLKTVRDRPYMPMLSYKEPMGGLPNGTVLNPPTSY